MVHLVPPHTVSNTLWVDVEPIEAQQIGKDEYRIALHIHPGSQYSLKELSFSEATLFSIAELRSAFHVRPNSLFDIGSARKGFEALQKAYEKKGHPNMTAVPAAVVEDSSKTIALEIKIRETRPLQTSLSS